MIIHESMEAYRISCGGYEKKRLLSVIRENCKLCMGSDSWKDISDCTAWKPFNGSKPCPFYPYRFGKDPFREKRELSPERREQMTQVLAKARENKTK